MNTHLYIISLARARERCLHCENEVARIRSKIDIGYAVIDAVDSQNLPPTFIDGIRLEYVKRNPGLVACSLSHRKALRRIIDDKVDFGIVVEDDFLVVDIDAFRDSLISQPQGWDLLQFHHSYFYWGIPQVIKWGEKWDRVSPCPLRSLSYAVTPAMAAKILERSEVIRDHYDHLLRSMSREIGFHFYLSRQELIKEAGFASTMQHAP